MKLERLSLNYPQNLPISGALQTVVIFQLAAEYCLIENFIETSNYILDSVD